MSYPICNVQFDTNKDSWLAFSMATGNRVVPFIVFVLSNTTIESTPLFATWIIYTPLLNKFQCIVSILYHANENTSCYY